jgi:broad-specificity NMP kinase
MSKIYFISGVCGVGKSTIIPYLQKILSENKYQVFDFDARGVPENAGREWRISESKYWTEKGMELAKENISTIICGFVKTTDLLSGIDIKLILLDIEPEILKQRLIKRYTKDGIFDQSQKVIGRPVNEFIESNIYILGQMREMFQEKNSAIIDTSNLTPEEAANRAVELITK